MKGKNMNYSFRYYGDIKHLVYKHKDGTEILSTSFKGLVESIKAYNKIYHNSNDLSII